MPPSEAIYPKAVCPYCQQEREFETYTDEQPGTLYICTGCRVCFLDEAFAAIQAGTYTKPEVFQPITESYTPLTEEKKKGKSNVTRKHTRSNVSRLPNAGQDTPAPQTPKQLTLDLDQ